MKINFCQHHTGARQFGRDVLCGKPTHGASHCPAHHAAASPGHASARNSDVIFTTPIVKITSVYSRLLPG